MLSLLLNKQNEFQEYPLFSLLAFLYQLFCLWGWHFLITVELHMKSAAPLRDGTKFCRKANEFAKRRQGTNDVQVFSGGLDTQDAGTLGI